MALLNLKVSRNKFLCLPQEAFQVEFFNTGHFGWPFAGATTWSAEFYTNGQLGRCSRYSNWRNILPYESGMAWKGWPNSALSGDFSLSHPSPCTDLDSMIFYLLCASSAVSLWYHFMILLVFWDIILLSLYVLMLQ